MIDRFDSSSLQNRVAEADLQLVVAERHSDDVYTAKALDTDAALIDELRADTIAWVQKIQRDRLVVPYGENTLLSEHEVALSGADIIDSQLVEAMLREARERPQRDAAPEPRLIRVYGLVATGEDPVLFVRRQNPVRHLGRGVITRLLLGSRLTEAPPIFVYDGQYDLVVWRNMALITRDTALDSLFMTEALRQRQTEEAKLAIAFALREEDATALDGVLANDRPFAAKLRKVHRAGHLDRLDPAGWQPTIEDFELGLRVEGDRLLLPESRSGRWELLSLIEDGFVRGAATGAKYRSNSQRVWSRRRVTSVRSESGRIRSIAGDGRWPARSASEAIEEIRSGRAEYVLEASSELHVVQVHTDQEGELLFAGEDENLLLSLPPHEGTNE